MGRIIDSIIGIDDCFKNEFGRESVKKRDFNKIRRYYDLYEPDEYGIDDETWDDLDMDEVFKKIDRSNSSPGEAALYCLLRNPVHDKEELKKRENFITGIINNTDMRIKMQSAFFRLGYDKKNNFLEMLQDEAVENKSKFYGYLFLGKILPFVLIAGTIILRQPAFLMALFILVLINMLINNYEKKHVKSNGMIYLREIISCAKRVSKIDSELIKEYTNKIKALLGELKQIDSATNAIYFANVAGGAFEIFAIPFLLEETAYYRANTLIKAKEDQLLELYYCLGELEAYISVASYRKELAGSYTVPIFTDELNLKVSNGVHPLIKDAVPNSIKFDKKGIVLTGTNMSGKSTFLRMLGLNMVLAQCFNFTLTERYEGCFFNIVTSISPNDDVTMGKSYYMAEADSLLRIINALNKELPVFCPIDEIFRGTNPIERIAASAEILTYINSKKSISIVATHDRELTDILKENYEFYYFSEKVNETGLTFDYKIKKGVTKTRNAIKLLDFIGYPKEIINNSFKRAEKLEKYI